MKKTILFSAVFLLAATGLAQAQEGGLHGSFDLTYQSKYVWRGFDVYGDKSAVQPTIDLDLFGTGLGLSLQGHRANSSGYELAERWDYTLYYQNRLFADQPVETLYRLGWVYYNYPDLSCTDADLQELHAILSWPKILGVKGLVPTYVLVKLWPSSGGSLVAGRVDLTKGIPSTGTASGFAHIFMLDYGLPIKGLMPDVPEQTLKFHSELVFNDGVGPAGQNVDHDWSNAVLGISTDFELAKNLVLTPGVYHQMTFESTVNDDKDETWVTVGLTYKF
ncbi:MAG: hypothetical protein JSU94_20485 [Phycisphaerales bacterium]|nr:MAG: hypothetical protein JSU94_20485 [Phycisphaerales bacterium]